MPEEPTRLWLKFRLAREAMADAAHATVVHLVLLALLVATVVTETPEQMVSPENEVPPLPQLPNCCDDMENNARANPRPASRVLRAPRVRTEVPETLEPLAEMATMETKDPEELQERTAVPANLVRRALPESLAKLLPDRLPMVPLATLDAPVPLALLASLAALAKMANLVVLALLAIKALLATPDALVALALLATPVHPVLLAVATTAHRQGWPQVIKHIANLRGGAKCEEDQTGSFYFHPTFHVFLFAIYICRAPTQCEM